MTTSTDQPTAATVQSGAGSVQPGIGSVQSGAGSVQAQLLEFLSARTKTAWAPDTDLFASGLVSSLFAMELVVFVERTFDVVVGGDDLNLDTFRTVDRITALVNRLRAEADDA